MRSIKISAISLGLSCFALIAPLYGSEGVFVQDETDYTATYNQHGMILQPSDGTEGIVYLGIGCDAFSPSLGTGRWSARGGHVYVEFTTGDTLPFAGKIERDLKALCPL